MLTEKIKFHEISTQDREWMTQRLLEEQPESCEYTFVSNFVWRKSYRVEVAQYAGCGVIRYCKAGNCMYSFPFGNGDKRAVLTAIKELCSESGCELSMYPVTEKYRSQLIEWFPGDFFIKSDRDDFDYIYLREKLADLKGRKFHGKRNHIARFKDEGDWSYEPITSGNLEECRRMHRDWITFREDKWDAGVAEETDALHEAFDHYEEFGLVGGLIRKAGEIVAFAIGEPLNDEIMVVHFEKAYPDMQGAYPMINQQFAINECENFKYINREEDTGDPGLRKAKLSYYPDILLKKYVARESHVTFADKRDFDDIRNLWKICFGDDEDYINFYLEHRFDEENMMVIREDDKIVSMASFLSAAIRQGEEWISVKYVYAVGTLPQYRKKGYASEIIRFASEVYNEPLVLQPASKELRKYYSEIGFVEFFERDCWEISDDAAGLPDVDVFKAAAVDAGKNEIYEEEIYKRKIDKNNLSQLLFEEVSAKEYKELRDIHFDRNGYLCWDEKAIEYALAENRLCGGRAVKINVKNNVECEASSDTFAKAENIILYRTENNVLRIVESTLEGEELEKAVKLLLRDNHCDKAVYKNEGGMILLPKNIGINEGYLNLTLG